jgi:hypothetical protein
MYEEMNMDWMNMYLIGLDGYDGLDGYGWIDWIGLIWMD